MQKVATWGLLFVLGVLLIVVGWRGRLGSLAGAIITPAQLIDAPQS